MDDCRHLQGALADTLRVMGLIFSHGPLCVCEVEQILRITQPKASRHLRYLRNLACWRTSGTG